MSMNMAGCISERRWTKVRLRFVSCAFLALTAFPCLGANKVTDVRYWSVGDVTRIAVEVSGEFRFKTGRIPTPERLYFDLANSVPDSKTKPSVPVGDGRV